MAATSTASETYSFVDIENVMRRVGADLRMIAESTGAITLSEAANYQADIELLAKEECLTFVDITLFDGSEEINAVRYTVNQSTGGLTSSRPGGVLWSRVISPRLRINLGQTPRWDALIATGKLIGKLKNSWRASHEDISHASLKSTNSRSYVSNSYGLTRQDYSK